MESDIRDFRASVSGSRPSMGILFSFYAILCLRGAFRNVTPCINGKGLYLHTLMPGSHIPVYCSRTRQNAAESTNILGIGEGI